MKCAHCKKKLDDGVLICPKCGATAATEVKGVSNYHSKQAMSRKKKKVWIPVLLLVLLAVAIAVSAYFLVNYLNNLNNKNMTNSMVDIKETAGDSDCRAYLDSMEGCPDFYNLSWDMTVEDLKKIFGDSFMYNEVTKLAMANNSYVIYDYDVVNVYFGIDANGYLEDVLFIIPGEYDMDEFEASLSDRFGEPDSDCIWIGKSTTVKCACDFDEHGSPAVLLTFEKTE